MYAKSLIRVESGASIMDNAVLLLADLPSSKIDRLLREKTLVLDPIPPDVRLKLNRGITRVSAGSKRASITLKTTTSPHVAVLYDHGPRLQIPLEPQDRFWRFTASDEEFVQKSTFRWRINIKEFRFTVSPEGDRPFDLIFLEPDGDFSRRLTTKEALKLIPKSYPSTQRG